MVRPISAVLVLIAGGAVSEMVTVSLTCPTVRVT